ncbi:uncharacterized protein LOC116250622 isoform X2 [Nymphaea colorata]|uniref:uncharacterized protein LOC116250622 isoform X2 n=1 Tax=Nymphaea colorata TaxID=210225 RepID=UPI00129EE09A|nr:uncharacterized protein LOC116250622 isoform X2 [Nymphaea colorata]
MEGESPASKRVLYVVLVVILLLFLLLSMVSVPVFHGFKVLVSSKAYLSKSAFEIPVTQDAVRPSLCSLGADSGFPSLGTTLPPAYDLLQHMHQQNDCLTSASQASSSLPPTIDDRGTSVRSPEQARHTKALTPVIQPAASPTESMKGVMQQPSLSPDDSSHYLGTEPPLLSPISPVVFHTEPGLVHKRKKLHPEAQLRAPASKVSRKNWALQPLLQCSGPTPPPFAHPHMMTTSLPIKEIAPVEHTQHGNAISPSTYVPMPHAENWVVNRRDHETAPSSQPSGPSSGISEKIPPTIAPTLGKTASPLGTVSRPPTISSGPHGRTQINGPVPAPASLLPSLIASAPDQVIRNAHVSIAPSNSEHHVKRIVNHLSPASSYSISQSHNRASVGNINFPSSMSPSMPDVKNWTPDRESHEPTPRSHTAAPSSGMGEKMPPPTGASPPAEVAAPRSEKAASPLHAVSQTPRLSSEPHARMQISEPIAAPSSLLPSPFSVTASAPEEGIKKRHVSIAPAGSKHVKRIFSHLSPAYSYTTSASHEEGLGMSPSPSQRASSLGSTFLLPPASPPTWRWHVQDVAPFSYGGPAFPDVISPPPSSSARAKKTVFPLLPPPPPNKDCESFTCSEPYTNTPSGSPCGCVLPIQVGLRLSVALYTFFPLVSELASEIATGVFMKASQVRVMGAIADNYQQEKTVVRIDLVPPKQAFDANTAFSVYEKFWHKETAIKSKLFGDYEVLYVRYPGLPPPPPSAAADTTLNGEPSIPENYSGIFKPLGVNVRQQRNKWRGSFIAIVALSSAIALVLCLGATWFFNFKCRESRGHYQNSSSSPWSLASSVTKPSGVGSPLSGSGLNSSFSSSIAAYTGSAKTFTLNEMGKATNNFNPARILGEGGFGRVYSGALEDGTKVAVKVLKREDRQGGKEFLAEVEMLNRLHHRNLVKLIGICVEERNRCLVYELVPNGSVESHLHGVDKQLAPLDWSARMKIALGSARGLAYLHEDSSPRVIHRDFKSSNILLEDDFTPKVSDFGLARAALTDGNEHISTRVMGTFGYVAPEYAMTGHLLVKSDVYSYGVVLLELLTGRKPVDMSQPQGRENLVSWAHPLLTSREGLEMIVDPAFSGSYPFDSVAKVAAIASMCVQPEVSNRPFMGEVVQALKLLCSEADEMYSGSENYSQESLQDFEIITSSSGSAYLNHSSSFAVVDCRHILESSRVLSASDILSSSTRPAEPVSDSFRRYPVSGPLRPNKRQQFWQRFRRLSGRIASEHAVVLNKSKLSLEHP